MLSIAKVRGDGSYYLDLAKEDYYLAGGEPPGRWAGKGAEALSLSGEVSRESFRALWMGRAPDGTPLVQNPDAKGRQRAWDLTFSAPKSVSLLWAMSEHEVRIGIQAAQARAVSAALSYLEREAGVTRRGKGGGVLERAALVASTFEHGTSRAKDPQLHTHVLVLNVGVREDGTTGTLHSKPLYDHKMAAGALYRMELSHGLRALGFETKASRIGFEVVGVPKQALAAFSKRRAAIVDALKARGLVSPRAAEVAALATRREKATNLPREELLETWKVLGTSLGFGPEEARALRRKLRVPRDKGASRIALDALGDVGKRGPFHARDVIREASSRAINEGLAATAIERAAARALKTARTSSRAPAPAFWERLFSTPDYLRADRKLRALADELLNRFARGLDLGVARETLRSAGLSGEALRELTESLARPHPLLAIPIRGSAASVSGAAELLRRSGIAPLLFGATEREARALSEGSGAPGFRVGRALAEWKAARPRAFKPRGKGAFDPPRTGPLQDHLARAFGVISEKHRRYNAWQRDRAPLDAGARHAFVVSSADKLTAEDLLSLLREADRRAARVILFGDVQEPSPFSRLASRAPTDGPRASSPFRFEKEPPLMLEPERTQSR